MLFTSPKINKIIKKLIPYRIKNPNVDLLLLLIDNVKIIGAIKESKAIILYSV